MRKKAQVYSIEESIFDHVCTEQLNDFRDIFNLTDSLDGLINIPYQQKFYNVNNSRESIERILESKTHAISFFSGAGGLDIGVQLAGVKIISTLDFDKDSVETIKANRYFSHAEHLCRDIKDVDAKEYTSIIKKNNPEKLVLVGGPPCQPFSKAGYWKTHANRLGANDPRNMISDYLQLIGEIKPDGFILENVESILHPKNIHAVHDLVEVVEKLGYCHTILKVNSIDYGVPQKRKRVFIVASKKRFINPLLQTHGTNTEIKDNPLLLPHERVIDWIGKYDSMVYSDNYDSTEGKYYENLNAVPPGGNYISLTERRGYPDPVFIAGKRYWSFLLKLHPLLPSWTIIASPGHWEGPFHWSSRRLRIKELAAIQTFPEDYIFKGSRRSIQKQIGNAVPSLLGQRIVDYLVSNI